MAPLKLQQLYYFEKICKYRNITRASEELLVSQPALTSAIKSLEEEFGVELFIRRSKGMELTEAGELLLTLSVPLLEHVQNVEREMKNFGHTHAQLRLGVAPLNSTLVFPYIFQLMREQYPDISIQMIESGSPRSLALLKDNKLDACIISGHEDFPSDICSFELTQISFEFYTHADHPLAKQESITLGDLDGETLALLEDETYLTSSLTLLFRQHGISPHVIMKTNQLTAIGQLTRQGVTSTILFAGMMKDDPSLAHCPVKGLDPIPIFLVWKDSRPLPYPVSCLVKASRSFIDTK